jgi:hypothetical protein
VAAGENGTFAPLPVSFIHFEDGLAEAGLDLRAGYNS